MVVWAEEKLDADSTDGSVCRDMPGASDLRSVVVASSSPRNASWACNRHNTIGSDIGRHFEGPHNREASAKEARSNSYHSVGNSAVVIVHRAFSVAQSGSRTH